MSAIDQVSSRRSGLMLVNGAAFAIWQATELGNVRELDSALLRGLGTGAVILWICTTLALLAPSLSRNASSMEDELTRYNRLAALSWGYWVMMLGTAAALVLASRTSIPAIDLVRLMLIAGVAAPLIRFGLMERPASDEE